jgi:hypothetical protein
VLRELRFLAAGLWILVPGTPLRAQELSLTDAARQVRESKKDNPRPKKVYTEDDFGPSWPSTRGGEPAPSNLPANASRASGDRNPMAEGWAGIDRAAGSLDKMEPLDRAALAKVVLEGHDVDFPNRRNWEERLFAAKQAYVARSRQLLDEMKGLMTSAQSLQSSQGGASKVTPETPQAQELVGRAQQLLVEATSTEAAFKAVMQEGQELAKQAQPH